MKILVKIILVMLIMTYFSVSCTNMTQKTPIPTKQTDSKPIDFLSMGVNIPAEKFGIFSISKNYFWSPSAKKAVFIGYIKDTNGKYTPNLYLLEPQNRLITKIMDGEKDKNYILQEPQWTDDENMFTFDFRDIETGGVPVCYYNVDTKKLTVLPFNGTSATISPDKSRIAYSGSDGFYIYDIAEKSKTLIPGVINGSNPIWFSDNTRILFFKATGKNPSKLEGADLSDICILNTTKPISVKALNYETVYRNMKWIIRDELVFIESGWDDGHYLSILNTKTSLLTNFGDNKTLSYIPVNGEIKFITSDLDNRTKGFELLDRNLTKLGVFAVDKDSQSSRTPLLLLPDNSLLYLKSNNSLQNGAVMITYLNENRFVQSSVFEEALYPFISENGSQIALINDSGKNLILIDASR